MALDKHKGQPRAEDYPSGDGVPVDNEQHAVNIFCAWLLDPFGRWCERNGFVAFAGCRRRRYSPSVVKIIGLTTPHYGPTSGGQVKPRLRLLWPDLSALLVGSAGQGGTARCAARYLRRKVPFRGAQLRLLQRGGNSFVYYGPDIKRDVVGPDLYIVNGGMHRGQEKWIVVLEGGLRSTLVGGVHVRHAPEVRPDGQAGEVPRQVGVLDCFLVDRGQGVHGFHLRGSEYVSVLPDADGRTACSSLPLEVGVGGA